jgi:1,4-alpha-glucan branching enzyme
VDRHPDAQGDLALVLNQAARELLLLQASDWPFLVTTGQAKEYAIERFNGHVERFHRLAEITEAGEVSPQARSLAEEYFALDNIFPKIDYRAFKSRERKT